MGITGEVFEDPGEVGRHDVKNLICQNLLVYHSTICHLVPGGMMGKPVHLVGNPEEVVRSGLGLGDTEPGLPGFARRDHF